MPFAAGLRESLQIRSTQVPAEFTGGDDLERVLTKHLLTIEAMADGDLITSILLLSEDGKRLFHGAAPRLPRSYCEAVDGSEIGPTAGSCGTAAYLGHPVYASDIATDPLWTDYRHLALPHGLRSCWSTPIRDRDGRVVGTFAIYSGTSCVPTSDDIEAIDMIADHVAEAILLARDVQDLHRSPRHRPGLRLIADRQVLSQPTHPTSRLLRLAEKLQTEAFRLDQVADGADSPRTAETIKATVQISRKLVAMLREIDEIGGIPSS